MKRILLGVVAALLAALVVFAIPVIWGRPWTPDLFYARVFLSFALRHPMLLTQLGMLENTPFRWYADDLDDMSPAAERREMHFVDENLKTLRSYDRKRMTPEGRLSADVLEWFLADQQRGMHEFPYHDYPVNQMFGLQSQIPTFLTTVQPLQRERDARAY